MKGRMRHLGMLALVAWAAGGALAAEMLTPQWGAGGDFALQRTLAAGKVLEICSALPAAAQVRWSYQSDTAPDFNIHHHEGDQVVYGERLTAKGQAEGQFRAASAQTYCWMWKAPSRSAARLDVKLRYLER